MSLFRDDTGMVRLWAFIAIVVLGTFAFIGLVGGLGRIAEKDRVACRRQGLDAINLPFPSLHATCVPRAGRAVDTIYVKQ